MAPRKKINYINNAQFLAEVIKHKATIKQCQDEGKELPQMPRYIGECLSQIANKLAYRPNFINYTYREDMIYDGLENAIMAFNNFNPEKTQNPFSYFTTIIWFAFIRRIQKEQKQQYIRYKMRQNSILYSDSFTQSGTSKDMDSNFIEFDNDHVSLFIEKYEKSMKEKKDKKIKKGEDATEFVEKDENEVEIVEQEDFVATLDAEFPIA